jgi:hypothetical protein
MSRAQLARMLLNRLGSLSPAELAAFLQGRAAHGIRKTRTHCVLARYLSRSIDAQVSVCPDVTLVGSDIIENPPNVRQFVELFDAGRFPLLVTDLRYQLVRHRTTQRRCSRMFIKLTPELRRCLAPWIVGEARLPVVPDCIPEKLQKKELLVLANASA